MRRPGAGRLSTWLVPALAVVVAGASVVSSACGTTPIDPVRRQAAGLVDPGANDPSRLPLDGVVDMTGRASVTVDTQDNSFGPQEVKVSPGTKVTWTNTGFNQHNVTPVADGQFEAIPTGQLDPQASADRTFATRGVYRYYCTIHGTPTKGQRGVIVVDDS